jgi:hypothetical protein
MPRWARRARPRALARTVQRRGAGVVGDGRPLFCLLSPPGGEG